MGAENTQAKPQETIGETGKPAIDGHTRKAMGPAIRARFYLYANDLGFSSLRPGHRSNP